MERDSEEQLEINQWGLNEEIDLFYNANMVANETLANLESMDAMTKQEKQIKQRIMDRCMYMLDKSTEYFVEMLAQLDVIKDEQE
jgi:2-phosphoglycerate kinase